MTGDCADNAPRVLVAQGASNDDIAARSAQLAASLGTELLAPGDSPRPDAPVVLVVDVDRLKLCDMSGRRPVCVEVDFVGGRTGFRRRSRPSIREPLARAVGRSRGIRNVFDATMGLARDAFQLCCMGCEVTAVERSPVLYCLVQDGLDRARRHGEPALTEIIDRLTVVQGDAGEILAALPESDRPDTVYLDPMYPASRKSALAQKEMRLCRQVVGDDVDAAVLFEVARRVARRRVVVKRSPHAPALTDAPGITYSGRKVRYDVYLTDGARTNGGTPPDRA